jgi:hypothetical protein
VGRALLHLLPHTFSMRNHTKVGRTARSLRLANGVGLVSAMGAANGFPTLPRLKCEPWGKLKWRKALLICGWMDKGNVFQAVLASRLL